MADKKQLSIGKVILQIALGAMLIIGGIFAFTKSGDFGEIALKEVFKGNVLKILIYAFGIIELIVGVFLIIELFAGDILGQFGKILKIIIAVMWVIAIVLVDFIGNGGLLKSGFSISSIYEFAQHFLVLGAMIAMF